MVRHIVIKRSTIQPALAILLLPIDTPGIEHLQVIRAGRTLGANFPVTDDRDRVPAFTLLIDGILLIVTDVYDRWRPH